MRTHIGRDRDPLSQRWTCLPIPNRHGQVEIWGILNLDMIFIQDPWPFQVLFSCVLLRSRKRASLPEVAGAVIGDIINNFLTSVTSRSRALDRRLTAVSRLVNSLRPSTCLNGAPLSRISGLRRLCRTWLVRGECGSLLAYVLLMASARDPLVTIPDTELVRRLMIVFSLQKRGLEW